MEEVSCSLYLRYVSFSSLELGYCSKKAAGDRILIPWKIFRALRWWSPETIKSALPSRAADRYLLSAKSSFISSILVLPGQACLVECGGDNHVGVKDNFEHRGLAPLSEGLNFCIDVL